MLLKVYKPTGFIALPERVVIYDLLRPGVTTPFYDFDFSGKKIVDDRRFNLPVGQYETDNNITQSFFKPSKNIPIPAPEIYRTIPFGFPVYFSTNKNKASIYFDDKKIVIDPSFKSLPRYCLDFVLSHEYGHFIYRTEKFADLYSMKRMLKMGYNKSQIRNAINLSLTKKHSITRKINMKKQTSKASFL